jgi:hypothetical protein
MKSKLLVINCFSGAGAGKTTVALLLAGLLKQSGVDCEYVDEWHKMSVWLNHGNVLEHPEMMLANQHQKLWALDGKVRVVVSDCPLLLFAPYAREYIPEYPHDEFEKLSLALNSKYQNLNLWIKRDPAIFKQEGRVQTLEQSIVMDDKIRNFVEQHSEIHHEVDNNFESVDILSVYVQNAILNKDSKWQQ